MYSNIKTIQIETSSLCNAACPQCMREWWGGDYSQFKQTYIPTEFYETQIPQHVYNNLEKITFSGMLGDPCMAPNLIEIIQVIKRKNPNIKISISTNGGMRNPEWWSRLSNVLSPIDFVTFGIDGLEDTNHKYRINVKWKKLIENASAFINNGGRAHWQFIVFAHNEHQIEIARAMSVELKFNHFFTVTNNRYIVEEIFNNKSTMFPPSEVGISPLKKVIPISAEWKTTAEKSCITCQSVLNSEMYIDVETRLLPCCYLAGAKFLVDETDNYFKLWNPYSESIKLDSNSWESIINSNFYIELARSWKQTFNEGRLSVCSGVCSAEELRFSIY